MIKRTETKNYTTKLIDFDNSFLSGNPPSDLEEVVGDMVYYSPELGRYVQGDTEIKPDYLQLKSDIFALGLIYSQYLTGKMPNFDQKRYNYPYLAVYNGVRLTVKDRGLPPKLAEFIDTMLLENPNDRPNIDIVFEQLQQKDFLEHESPEPAISGSSPEPAISGSSPEPATSGSSGSRLKGTLSGSIPEKGLEPIVPTGSKLKGKLAKS